MGSVLVSVLGVSGRFVGELGVGFLVTAREQDWVVAILVIFWRFLGARMADLGSVSF